MAANLERGATTSAFLNIRFCEKEGEVTPEMRRRMALIVPHFQRAVAIGRLFDQGKAISASLTEALDQVEESVILVGPRGQIAFANAPAEAMLAEETLLCSRQDRLSAVDPQANRALRDLFVAAEKGDTAVGQQGVAIALSTSSATRWSAHVLPLGTSARAKTRNGHHAVAMVLVRKTSPCQPTRLEAIAKQYRFTASELRVFDAFMKVSGVKAIAELLGSSQATVKTHLHHIFQKTGTSRQSDLVKLAARED